MASYNVGITSAPDRPAHGYAERDGEGFDETRLLSGHDFKLWGSTKIGSGIVLFVILLACAALGLFLFIKQPQSGAGIPCLLIVAAAVGTMRFTYNVYEKRIHRVEVFADGVRWLGPEGVGRLAWENVESVYRMDVIFNGMPVSELRLIGRDGPEVVFDKSIERQTELAQLIQNRCAEIMLPHKRAEAGDCAAEFGPVLVGRAGVAIDGSFTAWQSVARYNISGGWLWFHFREKGRQGIPLNTIPNYAVLLLLMGEFK